MPETGTHVKNISRNKIGQNLALAALEDSVSTGETRKDQMDTGKRGIRVEYVVVGRKALLSRQSANNGLSLGFAEPGDALEDELGRRGHLTFLFLALC